MVSHDNLSKMINRLNESDQKSVIDFVSYLTKKEDDKKQSSLQAMDEINRLFQDDDTWATEEDMINELADFRRHRMLQ